MIEIELDGKKVQAQAGSMIMHAAEQVGTYIPHFCYHKKLSIAANCRMCLVDVEKMPKPMPACATPVVQGMVVHTKSDKATKAQQSVMEFLLINHPLDCPICDQGGECQLQDLAVGYGGITSRYQEEKRVVFHKDVGPLVSMEEMSRCIHCTRCVRFGQEVAGVMELGMSHRGEHAEIETFLGQSIDSELSGNMIDICPVGALTSKPFRYSARTWELGRRKSISPHDSTGTNLIMQVKNHKVMRVVPFENESINECWIADRDRFSYEALNSEDRLTTPMIKQDGEWLSVDWQTALSYVANNFREIAVNHGGNNVAALVSPHATLEEMYLTQQLMKKINSDSIDSRLRHAQLDEIQSGFGLGMSIAELSNLQTILVLGSNLRKEHPLFAQRIRQAVRQNGANVHAINAIACDFAMPVATNCELPFSLWLPALLRISHDVASILGIDLDVHIEKMAQATIPLGQMQQTACTKIAQSLCLAPAFNQAILFGNAASHHPQSTMLWLVGKWIANATKTKIGFLTEAANTLGAQWLGVHPKTNKGLNAKQILAGGAKAVLLLNTEPEFDSAAGAAVKDAFQQALTVVSLNPFKANMDFCDVILPISPFTETSGTFVNAEGRLQSFNAVVKPLGETRPAWKVLRALSDLIDAVDAVDAVDGFNSSQEVLANIVANHSTFENKQSVRFALSDSSVSNVEKYNLAMQTVATKWLISHKNGNKDQNSNAIDPVVASIYQLDGLVRRSPSLQLTQDARVNTKVAHND